MQLAVDKITNDLILSDGGGVDRVTAGRYTVQLVQNRLKTVLNEWLLNPTVGWLNISDFRRGYDLFDIELRARNIILSTPAVSGILEMDLRVADRVLYLTFKAETNYGIIDVTIPWSP